MKKIDITAHSGCLNTEPNSLESIAKGFDCGADIAEIDIRMQNGTVVLSHDKTEQGRSYVTLCEAFDLLKSYPDKLLNLDIKEPLELKAIESLAEEKGVFSQIFLTGISDDFLSFAKSSKIPYYLNFGKKNIFSAVPLYIKHLINKTLNCGAVGINLNKCNCNKKLVKMFQAAGFKVSVWTVRNTYDGEKLIKMRPDNITCTNPDEIIPLIGSLKK